MLSIAHLDDRERMFFVSLLLNEVVAWMRMQRGTSTLRAMVYIDEMMGYLAAGRDAAVEAAAVDAAEAGARLRPRA